MTKVTVRGSALAAVLLAALFMGGCGADDDPEADPPDQAAPTSSEPTGSLSEVCDEIETTRPDTDFGFPTNQAQRDAFTAYAADLRELSADLDEESADSVDDFAESVEEVAEEQDGLEASEEIDEATADLRDDCSAAGTPIWQ